MTDSNVKVQVKECGDGLNAEDGRCLGDYQSAFHYSFDMRLLLPQQASACPDQVQ